MKLNVLTNKTNNKNKNVKNNKKSTTKKVIKDYKSKIDFNKPFLHKTNFSKRRNFFVKLNEENRGYTPNLSFNKLYKVYETIVCEHEKYLTKSLVIKNDSGDKRNFLAHNFTEHL